MFFLTMIEGPFVVPIAAFAMVLGIVVAARVTEYHKRRLQAEERMAAIAKGMPVMEEPVPTPLSREEALRKRARGLRTGGIVLVATSFGLAGLSWALAVNQDDKEILSLAAVSIVPFAIGIGLLVDYWLHFREIRQLTAETQSARL